ncbi:MAG: hypothetical protein CMF96_09945 [Candidatus Marinimicrobia bacterium]|nr:hypothetical protein [Candidatus Neomarinimicrobiota bacterium]|tara:strand:+ start:14571 stop:15449 length:879 start_codon:yes stop_codon:yes gene_type:complete
MVNKYENYKHDYNNPNIQLAIYLDNSIPFNKKAKSAFLFDSSRLSNRVLLPFVKVIARAFRFLVIGFKAIFPNLLNMPKFLHWQLYIGQKYFLTPEANYLIMRHFNIGSEILQFISDNVNVKLSSVESIKPKKLNEIKNNVYLNHDLNLFNFIIELNQKLKKEKRKIEKIDLSKINFSSVSLDEFKFEKFPNKITNKIDLATAIEIFSPIFQLYLRNDDHDRAVSSLQFDETIGIYAATILGVPEKLVLVNNRHPMISLSPIKSGFRLLLHGLSTEVLFGLLQDLKKLQKES